MVLPGGCGDSESPVAPSDTIDLSDPTLIQPGGATDLASYFLAFSRLTTWSDGAFLYVESDGMADHQMMVGIRSWQQQVPLPISFAGVNAWQIPLVPQFADQPVSARDGLFRGAIALAVNGVPIFNALNNRGADAYLAGELDDFGGHAGRADDYHYHIAPLHLQSVISSGHPIGVALDGFLLWGSNDEPSGSLPGVLDAYNGHGETVNDCHYHGTTSYPYVNGGLRGVVTVQDAQVQPQPSMDPIQEAGTPLAGATVTGFRSTGTDAWTLEYQLNGRTYQIDYSLQGNQYLFVFTDPTGLSRTETYSLN